MNKTFNVTIKFIDGEILEIVGATSYGIYSLDNDRYAYVDVNGCRNYFKHSRIKYIGRSRDLNRDDKTLIDIYVRDKSTGEIHRVGDNRHDSLDVVNGKVLYYNLQNGYGTSFLNDYNDDEYEFVNSEAGTLCDSYKGGCGAAGGFGETEDEAIEAWNRRATNGMD